MTVESVLAAPFVAIDPVDAPDMHTRWFTPLACGPGSPELSKSNLDMASKLFTFTFTFTLGHRRRKNPSTRGHRRFAHEFGGVDAVCASSMTGTLTRQLSMQFQA